MIFQFADIKKPKPYHPYTYNPEPKEWAVLNTFPKTKKLIVEVGSGKGDWILDQAQNNPGNFYIGIERTINKSKSMLYKTEENCLKNLLTIHADAIPLINQKFPNESVDEFYFFYPNPTPKKRQANQRFFVSSAFEVFDKALKQNGTIYLATNIEPYIKEATLFLTNIWNYNIIKQGLIPNNTPPRTAFESKYHNNKDKLWELLVIKKTISGINHMLLL